MEDGGRLVWRVGDEGGKCASNGTINIIGTPSAVVVRSYVWLYVWPNGGPPLPLPPLLQTTYITYSCAPGGGGQCVLVPNESGTFLSADCDGACSHPPPPIPTPGPGPPAVVGCASGQCDAFCGTSSTVHGCLARWEGRVSLRAPATGRACGGSLGPCVAPADACATEWTLCLSANASSPPNSGAGVSAFRSGISEGDCAAAQSDPRVFVAAMSHARPEWAGLPPAPCPSSPVAVDNGCAAPGGWGSEPVCCGAGCELPSCPDSVWRGGTRIHVGEGEACGGLTSAAADGVLCCKL